MWPNPQLGHIYWSNPRWKTSFFCVGSERRFGDLMIWPPKRIEHRFLAWGHNGWPPPPPPPSSLHKNNESILISNDISFFTNSVTLFYHRHLIFEIFKNCQHPCFITTHYIVLRIFKKCLPSVLVITPSLSIRHRRVYNLVEEHISLKFYEKGVVGTEQQ